MRAGGPCGAQGMGQGGQAGGRGKDAQAQARHALHEAGHLHRHPCAAPGAPLHAAAWAARSLHLNAPAQLYAMTTL